MVDQGKLKKLLTSGSPNFGTFLGMGTPNSAEIAALAGADWALLDLEHGGYGEEVVSPTLLAAHAHDCPMIVRVESLERIRAGRLLDAGVDGIMFPRAESAQDARDCVSFLSHPPHGTRGVATYNRAAGWGTGEDMFPDPPKAATIIQIETIGALNDVEEIAAIEGVDVLFVGPLDLSFSLGIPRQFDNDQFIQACEKVVSAAKGHGKGIGILAPTVEGAKRYREMGFDFIAIGSDSTILMNAMKNIFNQARGD